MKIIRYILLSLSIVVAIASTGCDKEETVIGEDDPAPVFAAEYIGEMKVTRDIINYPTPYTDSVVLLIDGTTYDLFITSDPRSTSLCDSRGAFRYSTVAKSVVLELEDFTFDLCDTLRIPQGLFPATINGNSLNFNGSYVVPETADTILYEFKLIEAPPR